MDKDFHGHIIKPLVGVLIIEVILGVSLKMMRMGGIWGWEPGNDDVFDVFSKRNRDDCLEPMRALRDFAKRQNIELHTEDLFRKQHIQPDFGLYVESIPLVENGIAKNYLILYETSLTVPANGNADYLNSFDKIFTWDLDLLFGRGYNSNFCKVAKEKLIEIRIPNPSQLNRHVPSFISRTISFCLIGSNRHANVVDERELYSERVRAIKWFESNALAEFKLYGHGWKMPEKRYSRIGKIQYRLQKIKPFILRTPIFPSYLGAIGKKSDVLTMAKFCICFENARDIRGYLTEKIFDCLFSGCIPIYWGEPNIGDWIPEECFIDFRKFKSYKDLYDYTSTMSESLFTRYQDAGQEFLRSEAFTPHSSSAFSNVIINSISEDLKKGG